MPEKPAPKKVANPYVQILKSAHCKKRGVEVVYK